MPTRAVQPLDRPYITAGTLIVLMAVIGFWPTYLQPLFTGASEAGQVIHFHATVYFGWLALFMAQAWFAASGRLALHMNVASTYLLVAAVLRMPIIGSPRSQVLFIGIWITPIVLAMLHDYVRQRLIHPVYLIGVATLAASGYRDLIRETGMWRLFTEWLARFFV